MGLTQKLGTIPLAIFTDSSNNVGIGAAASGSYKLQVTGTTNLTGALTGTSATFSGDLTLNNGSADGGQLILASSGYSNWNIDNFSGRFRAYYGSTEYFTITAAGNVGIGTSSPSTKLEVNGSGSANSIMTYPVAKFYGGGTGGVNIGTDGTTAMIATDSSGADMGFLTRVAGVFYERMRITSGGNLLVGTTSEYGSRLVVYGASATGSDFAIRALNSNNNNLFYVRNDGLLLSKGAYDFTTGGGANVNVDADGLVRRSTSSLKYKNNVENYSKGLAEVMQMRPVTYNSKNKNETQTYAGLIAEEIHELGLTEFVQYATDGTPDALSYSNMIALLTKAIQELKAEIDELKNK